MSQLFLTPFTPAFNVAGLLSAGAKLRFDITGTTTLATVYADPEMTTPLSNPVIADSAGRFPSIYLDGAVTYRVRLYTAADVQIGGDVDPYTPAGQTLSRFDLRDFGAIRRQDSALDYTTQIQTALNQAAAEGVNTVYCEESYIVKGTITIPSGISLVSAGGSTTYFDTAPGGFPARPAAGFYKPEDGLDGPLVIMGIGSSLVGMTLEHYKIGGATLALGGVLQMGPFGPLANNCNNMAVSRCTIIGHEIDYGINGSLGTRLRRTFGPGKPDCALMVFPETTLGTQRYYTSVDSVRLTNGWIGIALGGQTNSSTFTNVFINQVYRQLYLDGGASEVLGNHIEGHFTNIGFLPTTTQTAEAIELLPFNDQALSQADNIVISALNRVQQNKIMGYTECNGRTLSAVGEAVIFFNDIADLRTNERYPDHYPDAWAMPSTFYNGNIVRNDSRNNVAYSDSILAAFPINHSEGFGARLRVKRPLTENLPQMAGLNIAADANSRIIARWVDAATVVKASKPTLNGTLRVEVEAPGSGGVHMTEVKFGYRVTNKTTMAGEFIVKSVERYPAGAGNYLTGLNFLTGLSSGLPFGFAATLGNGTVAPATSIAVTLDCDVSFTDIRIGPYDKMASVFASCVAVDAAAVAESISMLTVAATAV